MKNNEFNELLQASDVNNSNHLHGVEGKSASASCPPPRGVGNQDDSLLYHSEINSNRKVDKKSYKPTSLEAKTFNALELNSKHWLKIYTPEYIGMLTCTFKENLTCEKESQRRWNSLNTLINRHNIFDKTLVKVKEYQKRGAVHYHILVKTHEPIRGNIDWDIYEQMGEADTIKEKRRLGSLLGKTATPHLRELWAWFRKKGPATKFGRIELMPLKKPHHIKNYIGKYLEKGMQDKHKGRSISYGLKAPKVANTKVSWVNGKASLWRRKLAKWTADRGIKNPEEMEELFGKSWSYTKYKEIMNDQVIGDYQKQQFDELTDPENARNKAIYPWKGQVLSGAFTHKTKEAVLEQWLIDDVAKRTNYTKHSDHYWKWKKAQKHKAFLEKVYG